MINDVSLEEQPSSLIDALKPLFKYVADLEEKIKYYEEITHQQKGEA